LERIYIVLLPNLEIHNTTKVLDIIMRLFEHFLLICKNQAKCLYFRRKAYKLPKTTDAQQKILSQT
jgi:hypothetical protein